jgi:hypothetical protein
MNTSVEYRADECQSDTNDVTTVASLNYEACFGDIELLPTKALRGAGRCLRERVCLNLFA